MFNDHSGITLVELLVVAAIVVLLVFVGYSFYLNQHHQWVIQDQISSMQQNLRAAMDELTWTIRMAGYGDLPGGVEPIDGVDADPDTIMVRVNPTGCQATLTQDMPNVGSDLVCDSVICFEESIMVHIYVPPSHPLFPYGEWFYITNIPDATHIQHLPYDGDPNDLSMQYPAGSVVMMLEEYRYYIDGSSDPHHPRLMKQRNRRAPQVYAEDIEDLDLTYTMADGSTTPSPTDGDSVRAVDVTLRARTAEKDPSWLGDHHRRRMLSCMVQLRNLAYTND